MAAAANKTVESTPEEFVITRTFDAPRAMVFKAWTDARQLGKWWGPRAYESSCEVDARVGGAYRITMHGEDGVDYPMRGVYREIVENERIVYTADVSAHPESWHDQLNPKRDRSKGLPAYPMVHTVTFEERDGKTQLTVTMRFESKAVRELFVKLGTGQGWAESFDKLEESLSNGELFAIWRVFDAPIDLVWKAFTEGDRLIKWWGPAGMEMRAAKVDFRPGGLFHYCMRAPNGPEMWGRFVYREIVPQERIVFVNSFSDAAGGITRNTFNAKWPAEVLNRLTLSDWNGKTYLQLRGGPINATEEERKLFASSHSQMQQGFKGTFDQLDAYLSEAGREIAVSRLLDAPRELVWKAWTEADRIAQWWGPNGFRNTIHEMDVRPGGRWSFIMHGPDGTDYANESVFVEVVKHERIVFDHVAPPFFRATATFSDEGGKTRLNWRMVFPTVEVCEMVAKNHGAREGAIQNVDKLEAFLAKR